MIKQEENFVIKQDSLYPLNVRNLWIMLYWHEEQSKSIKKLNSIHWHYAHVDKDSKQHRNRNYLQKCSHQDRKPLKTSNRQWAGSRGNKSREGKGGPGFEKDTEGVRVLTTWQTRTKIYLPTNKLTKRLVTRWSFTSRMWGFSPGACVRLMTVRLSTWEMARTMAADIHGPPMTLLSKFNMHIKRMSKWNPEPFFNIRSFFAIISLQFESKQTEKSVQQRRRERVRKTEISTRNSLANLHFHEQQDEKQQRW